MNLIEIKFFQKTHTHTKGPTAEEDKISIKSISFDCSSAPPANKPKNKFEI